MIPRPVAGLSAPREGAVHGALDPAATLGLVPSNIERGVFEQGVAVVEERYLGVVQMVVNPLGHGFPRHVWPLPQIIDEPRNDDAHRRALVALRIKPIPRWRARFQSLPSMLTKLLRLHAKPLGNHST